MTQRRRGEPDLVQVIGGSERFDAFFDREAGRVLETALLIAVDREAAESATRRALAKALREWDRLGATADPSSVVRGWAFDRAWPKRRLRRGADPGGEEVARLRAGLWAQPRRHAREFTLAAVAGDTVVLDDDPTQVEEALQWVREEASGGTDHLRPGARDTSRWVRAGLAVLVAAAVLAALAMLRVRTPPTEEASPTTTTRPTALPAGAVVLDELPWWYDYPVDVETVGVALPGWERLTAPGHDGFSGRAVWTGRGLFTFVFSGDRMFRPDARSLRAMVYDVLSGTWSDTAPLPAGLCGTPWVMVPLDDAVVARFSTWGGGGCSPAAAYLLNEDRWILLSDGIFDGEPDEPVVWTGDLLVAPGRALAYRWDTGETIGIPRVPGAIPGVTRLDAHWTGTRVLVVGEFGVLGWTPLDDEWEVVDDTPLRSSVFSGDRNSAWTEAGLVALHAGGVTFHDGRGWRHTGYDASSRCWAMMPPGPLPVVSTCLGYAVWDEVRGTWVPYPGHALGSYGEVVQGDGALYVVGDDLARLSPASHPDGSLVPSATIPVGWVYLDVPDGFAFVGSSVSVAIPGALNAEETWAVDVETLGEESCTMASTMRQGDRIPWPEGFVEAGRLVVVRPGTVDLDATALTGGDGIAALAFAPRHQWWGRPESTLQVLVTCIAADTEAAGAAAMRLAAGLWTPWEGSFFAYAESDREFVVMTEDGGQLHIGGYPTDPDRETSERAAAAFRACAEAALDVPDLVFSQHLLVDADGELLSMWYHALRPGHSPPVAHVPDAVREVCFEAAGIRTSYVEYVQ